MIQRRGSWVVGMIDGTEEYLNNNPEKLNDVPCGALGEVKGYSTNSFASTRFHIETDFQFLITSRTYM